MGKRHKQRDAKSARVRLDELLAKGDTRGAVEAAKALVREEPGAASESLAVGAYVERIKALIAEGLGREAAAIASIVRERFPAHAGSWTPLLEDARLAAGDLDWMLSELRTAPDEPRAAIEERLLPWIADPSAIARSSALDPSDPLARESRNIAEVFEIVTSRLASPEELALLTDVRRRSPLAPWKLLVRAIDAFHRNEDERVAANVAAIDARSPAARGGEILSQLTGGRQKAGHSSAVERLIDRISGGRAMIAAQIRTIEAAARDDDRRRMREELRALTKSFEKLSPYALEQLRIALLPVCGIYFEPEQIAAWFRLGEHDRAMPRYSAIIMEATGAPFASSIWIAYADGLSQLKEIEPWQAAEIYLHVLSLGDDGDDDDDDEFVCRDPSHGHPVEDSPESAKLIEKIIAANPAPAVLVRIAPYFDRLDSRELWRVLTAWRKSDPQASEPLVRLLRIASKERRFDDALALIRQGDGMKIIDPEYARLRVRLLFRNVEQLLTTGKRGAAGTVLAEIARRPEDLGEDGGTYLLALQWAAAPPEKAGDLLAELARRGVAAELVMAEVTGDLGIPYALPASHPSPDELLQGIVRGLALLQAADKLPQHCSWLVERAQVYLDRASEPQLMAVGTSALVCRMYALAWEVTARGLEINGAWFHRMLMLRAEILVAMRTEPRRAAMVIEAARVLSQQANDGAMVAHAAELGHDLPFFRSYDDELSQDEISAIIDRERTAAMPASRVKQPRKKKAPRPPKKTIAKSEKGLFEE